MNRAGRAALPLFFLLMLGAYGSYSLLGKDPIDRLVAGSGAPAPRGPGSAPAAPEAETGPASAEPSPAALGDEVFSDAVAAGYGAWEGVAWQAGAAFSPRARAGTAPASASGPEAADPDSIGLEEALDGLEAAEPGADAPAAFGGESRPAGAAAAPASAASARAASAAAGKAARAKRRVARSRRALSGDDAEDDAQVEPDAREARSRSRASADADARAQRSARRGARRPWRERVPGLWKLLGRGALKPPPRDLMPPRADPWARAEPLPPAGIEAVEALEPPASGVLSVKPAGEGWVWFAREEKRWWAWAAPGGPPLLRHEAHWWQKRRGVWFLLHEGEPWGWQYLTRWKREGLVHGSGVQLIYSRDGSKLAVVVPDEGAILLDAATGEPLHRWSQAELPDPLRSVPKPAPLPR